MRCKGCKEEVEITFAGLCLGCAERISGHHLQSNTIETGGHYDEGKLRVDLVPTELIAAAARAYGYGAEKYGDLNFRGGIRVTRLLGSTLRHIYKWMDRGDIDEESGLNHLDHAAATLGMILWMIKNRPDLDDRWKK